MRHDIALVAVLGTAAIFLAACDDKKDQPTARTTSSSSPSAVAEPAKTPPPDKVPDILVDAQGAYLGGERANLSLADGAKKLRELLSKYPIAGKPVTLVALRNARSPDVETSVDAVGDAGAETVTIRTQDRAQKDATITVVPEKKLGKLPDCTMVAMLLKDRSTATWPIRGATATKYSRGMAGPDISSTLDGLRRGVAPCASTTIVFAGEDTVEWGLTFDLGTRIGTADPPFKTTTFVLTKEPPVAGLKVKLGD